MKKTISIIILLLALALALAGCSRNQAPAATPVPTAEGGAAPASATDTSSAMLPPASSTDTNAQSAFTTAQGYIGRSVQDLYAAVGQPAETAYGHSEQYEDAEEGMLFYDGFYVWTLRTAAGETVQEVYLDQ